MDGYVYIGGHELRGSKKIIYKPDKIPSSTSGTLTIEQWIIPEQVALVTKSLESELGAFFYLDRLKITFKSTEQFPPIEPDHLKLQEHICSKDKREKAAVESKEAEKRASNIEQLTYVLGMLFQAIHQYESGQPLPKSELEYLDSVINQTLWNSINDSQVIADFYSVVKSVPSELSEQQLWLQNNRSMLLKIIEQQRLPKSRR
jgi:hypothetical protein